MQAVLKLSIKNQMETTAVTEHSLFALSSKRAARLLGRFPTAQWRTGKNCAPIKGFFKHSFSSASHLYCLPMICSIPSGSII